MSLSLDQNLFFDLLEKPDAILVLDNDMCIVSYGDEEHQSFDFGPKDLVELLAEKLGIKTEHC